MISVEEIKITLCLISGTDIILILEPLGQLLLYFLWGILLQFNHPVVKPPTVHRHRRIVYKHYNTLIIQAFQSLSDLLPVHLDFRGNVVQVKYLGIILIKRFCHIVSAKFRAVGGNRSGFGEADSPRSKEILFHPFLLLLCS